MTNPNTAQTIKELARLKSSIEGHSEFFSLEKALEYAIMYLKTSDDAYYIKVKDIEDRITALEHMSNEQDRPEEERLSLSQEADHLQQMLIDFGYGHQD